MPSIHVPAYELQRAFDAVNMSGFLSGGRYTKQFEHEVSRWCGLESVAVANCGMGLYAILDRVPKGRDEGTKGMSWVRHHDRYPESKIVEVKAATT